MHGLFLDDLQSILATRYTWLLKCGGKIGFGGLKGSCLRLWVTRNQFLMNTTVKGYKIKRTTKFKFLPSIKAGLSDRLGFSR